LAGEQDIIRWPGETSLSRGPLGSERPARRQPVPTAEVSLPEPAALPINLWQVLAGRRSRRDFRDAPLSLAQVGTLLWAAQGVTARGKGMSYRTAPSAGALYPVNTYLAVRAVEGLEPGLWAHYAEGNALGLIRAMDISPDLTSACLGQGVVKRAAAVAIFTATVARCSSKYGQRAFRYVFMDAAHACQNLLLAAHAIGLGACPVGAFLDAELDALLGIDGKGEASLYLAAIGRV